jgi:hypothetical protein
MFFRRLVMFLCAPYGAGEGAATLAVTEAMLSLAAQHVQVCALGF